MMEKEKVDHLVFEPKSISISLERRVEDLATVDNVDKWLTGYTCGNRGLLGVTIPLLVLGVNYNYHC